jgi:hypothetical protein
MSEVITGVYDFDIKAGATLTRYIQMYLPKVNPDDTNEARVPYPFTGFTGKAQVRKNAAATIAYDLVVTFPADGLIKIYMSDENTSLIPCGNLITDMKSKYQWALELTDSTGEVMRPLEGMVRISPELVR